MLTDQELDELNSVMVSLALVGHITQVNFTMWRIVLKELRLLRTENALMLEAIESAGSWITGAKVAVEPGWAGSTNHILQVLSEAVNHDTK